MSARTTRASRGEHTTAGAAAALLSSSSDPIQASIFSAQKNIKVPSPSPQLSPQDGSVGSEMEKSSCEIRSTQDSKVDT
jgi:hypothetical protein